MRKTKIICTLGPASSSEEVLKELILKGMDVARFNMSHGGHEDHAKRMELVRRLSKELKRPVGILLDTKGPEVRIKMFKNGKVEIKDNQMFTFTTDDVEGDENQVSVNYKHLPKDMRPDDIIMCNDGLVKFKVQSVKGNNIHCICLEGGTLSNQKSCNFPNKVLSMPFISEQDKADLIFGCQQKVDYVAASFVSTKDNVLEIRELLNDNGGQNISIIAKIENAAGVENIDSIFEVADGVMVARGDMGVEIPYAVLPGIQRMIISKAKLNGKIVIVATEMLESMIHNPRPTRAETNDVATAIYEGASATMLSGETAAGAFPVQCVSTMSKIARGAEEHINYFKELKELNFTITHISDALAFACSNAANSLKAKMIVVFTTSGRTAQLVSRFKPGIPIVAATSNEQTYTKMTLCWGVFPELVEPLEKYGMLDKITERIARERGCKDGDIIIYTHGYPLYKETNDMKILRLTSEEHE